MTVFFAENLDELKRKLAYEYWERRGRPLGSPEIDWIAAEKALASTTENSKEPFSLCGLRLEPDEGPYRSHDLLVIKH